MPKPHFGTLTAGLESPGRNGRKALSILAPSSVPPRSHKVVSKGPALVRLGARVRVRRRESPRAAGASR